MCCPKLSLKKSFKLVRLGIHLFNWDANSGFTVRTNKKKKKKYAFMKIFSQNRRNSFKQGNLGIHLFNWDADSGFTVSTNKKNRRRMRL